MNVTDTVSPKNVPPLACNNHNTHEPIVIILADVSNQTCFIFHLT